VRQSEGKITYLVQGNLYKDLITKLNDSSHVLVIGKHEEELDLIAKNKMTVNPKLILVPDGDKSNIVHFLNLTKLIYNHISTDIVISLHPDTHIGLINLIKLYDLKRKGLIKSSMSNLKIQDLTSYQIIVYTSSNLAIKSLLMEMQLIYTSESDYVLDPLWLINQCDKSLEKNNDIKLNVRVYPKKEFRSFHADLNYGPLLKFITQK
jgi:hypothetical protein